MSFKHMEEASVAVFDKYHAILLADRDFNNEEFRVDLDIATGSKNLKQSDKAIAHLWHATKSPVLLYFLDKLDPKRAEFQFFVARAYGSKIYDEPSIEEGRERYWEKFYATSEFDSEKADEPFVRRNVHGKRIPPILKQKPSF